MPEPFFLIHPVTIAYHVNEPFDAPRPYANGKHEGIDLFIWRGNFFVLLA